MQWPLMKCTVVPLLLWILGQPLPSVLFPRKANTWADVLLRVLPYQPRLLYQRAAKLPKVELVRPPRVICKNTVNSMQAGIIYGYVGQVDYIVKLMKKELGREDTKVIATGGLAGMIAEVSETIEGIEPNLTLEGLRIIYQRNQ